MDEIINFFFFLIKCFEVEAMELSKTIKTKYMTWFYDGIY